VKILWDESKNAANRRKHGISFEDASVLLLNEEGRLEIYDDAHSSFEDRFLAIGPTVAGLIVIVYSEPGEGLQRLISARRATRRETKWYASFVGGSRP